MNDTGADGPGRLEMPGGPAIACRREDAATGKRDSPEVVRLGGFGPVMDATKARSLATPARRTGFGFVRFGYSGHGLSEGEFRDGAISRRLALPLAGRRIGSASRASPGLAGLVLIAPAVDMTERLIWQNAPPDRGPKASASGLPATAAAPVPLRGT